MIWIATSQFMPPTGTPCLVMTNANSGGWSGGIGLVSRIDGEATGQQPYWKLWYLNVDEWEGWKPGALYDFEVTHWMPLPEPPA